MLTDTVKQCQIGSHQIAYHRLGEGETLLLVHGITTYSFIWNSLITRLSKNYDLISVDLLGCGDSDMPLTEDYSIKSHAKRLRDFVSELGISKMHLVGHDLGGGISQIFAVNYPDLLLDLSLINSVAYDFWPVQPIIAMRTPIIRQFAMATLELGVFKLLIKRALYHKDKLTDELMNQFWKPMRTKLGRKAFLHFAKCINNQDLLEIEDKIRELKIPVLIIRGETDPYLSLTIAEKLHSEIPGSKLVRIETAGHFAQIDEPDMIAEILTDFF